jgi:hypothetical protein
METSTTGDDEVARHHRRAAPQISTKINDPVSLPSSGAQEVTTAARLQEFLAVITKRQNEVEQAVKAAGLLTSPLSRPEYRDEIASFLAGVCANFVCFGRTVIPEQERKGVHPVFAETEAEASPEAQGIDPVLMTHPAVRDMVASGMSHVITGKRGKQRALEDPTVDG